jgi:hypothetical protein
MKSGCLVALVALFMVALGGCAQNNPKAEEAKGTRTTVAAKKAGDHSGWWCDEHGVPEEVCGQCNAKVAAEFKKKGDWCKEHDRPDSQCFICHPELKDKFAAQYRAKYGKEPPPMEEEKKSKKEQKG